MTLTSRIVTVYTCQVTQSSYFDEYRIEGKDDTGAILMSVSPEILAKSLCNTLGASSVKVKLAKKQSACLSVEIALPSPGKILFLQPISILYKLKFGTPALGS